MEQIVFPLKRITEMWFFFYARILICLVFHNRIIAIERADSSGCQKDLHR